MRFFVPFLFAREAVDRQSQVIHFDQGMLGKVPKGWIVAATHPGADARWESVQDNSAPSPPNVLAQLSQDKAAGRFPLAIGKALRFETAGSV